MKEIEHQVDFCVVGGGMSGLCAAIAAARHGAKVLLMHDRPVLGGNASSEIRMHICGAHGASLRETGILEEILLKNHYRNASCNWSLWDSVLYEAGRFEPGLELLLNCSCNAATMDGTRLRSVKGWQLTTETWHTVHANLFLDASGDGILAPLSGADFRIGREAKNEFGESLGRDVADNRTMGMSCLIQARDTGRPQNFVPPEWAYTYRTDEEMNQRGHGIANTNFWWLEVGGMHDSIHDTEELRDELLKIALGVWDHIKNHGEHGAQNFELEWLGFLPGKRESRRYRGDHVLTQNDVRAEGRFDDLVAYGGWSMDDHHPEGFHYPGEPTIFHPAPSPFGIPYRSLYSRNIENLFCAGRNISATHMAMSATRVMATCAVMGQAVGTAAAIAVRQNCGPRAIHDRYLGELQKTLLDDDCFLPWQQREIPEISRNATLAASAGDPEPLRNGIDRPCRDQSNAWQGAPGVDFVEYQFKKAVPLTHARIVFDSHLDRPWQNMPYTIPHQGNCRPTPDTMTKCFRLDVQAKDGQWRTVHDITDNHQRLVHLTLAVEALAVRLTPLQTWGAPAARLFAFEVGSRKKNGKR